MSNSSYLCTTNTGNIYPCNSDSEYNKKEQTIAYDELAVPMLWIVAFRTKDLKTQNLKAEGDQEISLTAPICLISEAIENLKLSKQILSNLFFDQPNIPGYFDYMIEAIASSDKKWLTIEFYEMEWLFDEGEFLRRVKHILSGFDDSNIRKPFRPSFLSSILNLNTKIKKHSWKRGLLWIAGIKPGEVFPSSSMLHDDIECTNDEYRIHTRLLGGPLYRDVPWEKNTDKS